MSRETADPRPTGRDKDPRAAPWSPGEGRPLVEIRGLTKRFGEHRAVDGIDLDIHAGELFTILGGSGSGKTTLLRLLSGFETPDAGSMVIDGVDMQSIPPYQRPVNMMFQSYALFPHMTVEQNVAYGLKKDRVDPAEIADRVAEMLDMVRLKALARRKPHRLSGGESQRVALARALVKRPKLLLLDEPLAALDKKLREHTQFELMNLQDELGITFVVVTHDQEEAMTLSSRIAVMNEGRLEQVGTPGEIYEYPCNRFVADFVGTINLLPVSIVSSDGDLRRLACDAVGAELEVIHAPEVDAGAAHWLAVRPEKIFISTRAPEDAGRNVLKGVVLDLGYFGNRSLFRVRLDTGTLIQVNATNRQRRAHHAMEWDDEVYVSWDPANGILLDR